MSKAIGDATPTTNRKSGGVNQPATIKKERQPCQSSSDNQRADRPRWLSVNRTFWLTLSRFMEFIDNSGLANTRIAGNKNEFRITSRYDTVERRQQRIDFGCPSVQFLGNQQSVRLVVPARQELVDASTTLPFLETSLKIKLQPHRRLISLFGDLGEQLHNDGRDWTGNAWCPVAWRQRLSCDLAVHPFHWIRSNEREATRQ